MAEYSGYILAILSALSWAFGTILFSLLRSYGNNYNPVFINLYKNTIGFCIIGSILYYNNFPLFSLFSSTNSDFNNIYTISIIVLSGIIGMGIAESLYISAISLTNVNFVAIIGSTLSLFIFIFSVLFSFLFPEKFPLQNFPPSMFEFCGFTLIIAAIIISSWNTNKQNNNYKGGIYALIAISLMGLSASLTNSVVHLVRDSVLSILWFIWIRLIPGIITPLLISLSSKNIDIAKSHKMLMNNKKELLLLCSASVMFSCLAISFWAIGMSYESENVAIFSILAQTSNLLIFVLGWLLLKEKIDKNKIIGILLSFIGVILIVLSR